MMDGSYHQFVNNKKQNHFINAETHRPDFVHSETKKRNGNPKNPSKKKKPSKKRNGNPKNPSKKKKPSKKKNTDESSLRLKALEKYLTEQSALNGLPGMYNDSEKHEKSKKNKKSKKYSDEKPYVKGRLGWKVDAIKNTRHLERSDSDESVTSDSEKKYSDEKPYVKGRLGWKVDAIKNTRHLERSDSDESVTSDSESDLSSDSESEMTENLVEMTEKPEERQKRIKKLEERIKELKNRIVKAKNNNKLKAVYSREIAALELAKKKEMCPMTGYGNYHRNMYTHENTCKAKNTCNVTTKNCLNYNRKRNAKLMCGEKLLVELIDDPWEHIPCDYDTKIKNDSKPKDRKKLVNKNQIVKLIKEGPRYLQYQSHSKTSYVFSFFDGSGNQDAASIPAQWVNVSEPEFMNKPPICPLQQFQLIDVEYLPNVENDDPGGIWIGRYIEEPETYEEDKWNIYACHSTEKDNTGNILQQIMAKKEVKKYDFYPYGLGKQNRKCQELNKTLNKNDFHEIGKGSKWKHHDQPFIKQGDVLSINNGHIIDNMNIWDLVYVIDDNIDEYGEPYHRVHYVYIDENGKKIPPPDRASEKVKEEYGDLYDSANDSNEDDYNDSELEDKMKISEELDVWFNEYIIMGRYSELYPNSTPPFYGTKKDEVPSADDDDGDDGDGDGDDDEYKHGEFYEGLEPGPWKNEFLPPKTTKGKNGKNSEEDSISSSDDEENIVLSSDEE